MAANTVQIQKFLSGIDYPCSKQQVISYARDSGADQNVLDTLQRMPGSSFDSVKDISQAIGQIE